MNPQRGHAGSTGGAFRIVVAGAGAAGEAAADCRTTGTAWSAVSPEEQLAATRASATTPAAEAIARTGRRHVDPQLPDDT
ncbi:hypothetical protein [Streptosporangium sp. LJ11]|uniref:hypothetical protein n=1 Tax=Streptosporangium sp. LJ11 TaxID=3436927 RepID=UPI003F7A4FA6